MNLLGTYIGCALVHRVSVDLFVAFFGRFIILAFFIIFAVVLLCRFGLFAAVFSCCLSSARVSGLFMISGEASESPSFPLTSLHSPDWIKRPSCD